MGVHPRSGKPLGIPGDYLTRQKRMQAHALFDRLWRNGGMRRPAAYAWMQEQMGLDERTGHISMMNAEQCDQLIAILQRRLEREYLSRMGGVPVPEDA